MITTEIVSVRVRVAGIEIVLTAAQVRELRDALNELLGEKPLVAVPYRWPTANPPYEITWTDGGTAGEVPEALK